MKKIFRKIHLWLSIPIGLIVSLICITGAILVFETEITQLSNSNRYYVKEIKENSLSLDELAVAVNKQLPDTLSVASIQVFPVKDRTWRIGFSGRNRMSVYVDPYTGTIADTDNGQPSFFSKTRQLHRWLLLQDDARIVGKRIVGITTIIFVIILISGIVIWMPKNRKQLKKRLKIRVKSGKKRFWYDLHSIGGIYTAIILLVLALTGLTWSFDWYRSGFYGMFGVEIPQQTARNAEQNKQSQNGKERSSDGEKKKIDYSNWQTVLEQQQNKDTSYRAITIQDGSVSVALSPIVGNNRASDRYIFDSGTGLITDAQLYSNQEKSGKLRGWIYSVHVGSWGGIATKIVTFIAALLGGILPLTGYYLYIKKRIIKKNSIKL